MSLHPKWASSPSPFSGLLRLMRTLSGGRTKPPHGHMAQEELPVAHPVPYGAMPVTWPPKQQQGSWAGTQASTAQAKSGTALP